MANEEPAKTEAAPPPADVEKQVAELRGKVEGLTTQLARTRAELANALKDRARELDEAEKRAQIPVLRLLGDVLDDLERAMEMAATADPAILTGLELVKRRIEQAFEARGVVVDRPVGLPFDPRRHEAVIRETTSEHPDGTIIEVLQPGLVVEDRVVRPALVKVAVGGKTGAPAGGKQDRPAG